jgi:serine/threonine protein kinase
MASVPFALAEALSARYTLEREIGRGGMATVFLARDLRHDRLVALKVLHPELAATLGPDRFLREIDFAARLQHPHILTVLDSGEAAEQLWFTMPFVEGESLRDRLRREQQLPVELALRIATDAARALQYAHEHGVIHRDIKPENLLLTKDGSTLVADFGIARTLSAADDRLTETGISVGTPAYMSPEQAAGDRTLDARTDVYALGAVLYEMLAGEAPFTGATAQAVTAKRFSGAVPRVRTVRPGVSQGRDHAVTKALSLVPADRFASTAEFAQALVSPAVSGLSETSTVGQAPRRVRPPRARRRMPMALLIGLGVLVLGGLGGILWHRSQLGGAVAADVIAPKRLAVLPFENLGDSADAYFADGITDAVRGKLTALSRLQVTARTSSSQYRTTSKSPQQIGKELGVQYLLAATVCWEKGSGGRSSRVQVSPELIDASTGSLKWQAPFSAALTDIFEVQSDIAQRVAEALNLALEAKEHRTLAEKPTQALSAYDAFLRGEEITRSSPSGLKELRRAVEFYKTAVALDSTFVMAWVRLALWHSILSSGAYTLPQPREADAARHAAERALALRPRGYEGHLALGNYYLYAVHDDQLALDHAKLGLRVAPGQPELLDVAGTAEMFLGLWDSALVHTQQEVQRDPRSADATRSLAIIFLYSRRYRDALGACNRGLTLEPGEPLLLWYKVSAYLALGDIPGAQSAVRETPRSHGVPTVALTLAIFFPRWMLEDGDQQRLLRLKPVDFEDLRDTWALSLAETYWLRGDRTAAKAYADSARQAYESLLRERSIGHVDAFRRVSLGVMLAFLGEDSEAVTEGTQALTLLPLSKDAVWGTWVEHQLARIYTLTGEPEKALDHLEHLLRSPSYLSPEWLRIEPTFAALRGNPRFERLVATK